MGIQQEVSSRVEERPVPRSQAPVFVLGCPRSGTTLLYHMLLSAGNFVVYRTESQVFNLLEPRFGNLSLARNKRKLLAAWRDSHLFTATGLDAPAVDAEVMARCGNAGDFLRIVMDAMARQQRVERWADCTPDHLLYLSRIKETIPDALVIHIIRDGRDVALSSAKQGWIRPFPWDKTKQLEVAALHWEWMVTKGRESGKLLGTDYVEVHFEDLTRTPRQTLATLSHFIEQDLDYDRIQRVGIGSVSQPNSSFAGELRSGNFNPVARWRTALSNEQLALLELLVGQTLQQCGYVLATSEAEMPKRSALERMRAFYHWYFDTKLFLKTKTPLGRIFATRDLSWV